MKYLFPSEIKQTENQLQKLRVYVGLGRFMQCDFLKAPNDARYDV